MEDCTNVTPNKDCVLKISCVKLISLTLRTTRLSLCPGRLSTRDDGPTESVTHYLGLQSRPVIRDRGDGHGKSRTRDVRLWSDTVGLILSQVKVDIVGMDRGTVLSDPVGQVTTITRVSPKVTECSRLRVYTKIPKPP